MKTFAASIATVLFLCAPALADSSPPPPRDWLRVHFAVQDGATQAFDVAVAATGTCATVNQKLGTREIELSACPGGDGRLDIDERSESGGGDTTGSAGGAGAKGPRGVDWRSRTGANEYDSRSSIPATRGAQAQLGSAPGPRLEVTVQ